MTEETWTREIEVGGERFTATFIRRPFREGLEVRIDLPTGPIVLAELGLGERALLEKARAAIREKISK